MKLLEKGEIKPVKASKGNGKKPTLYREYWIIEEQKDYSSYIEEIKYTFSTMLSVDYYLGRPDMYEKDRVWVLMLNEYLKKHTDALLTPESLNEPSVYYMRRDDTDIFADKNEGKVLIMDNPFAQTNASHLLIPLMDMAKKSNTQLICLTGLGGESIYNRFDNIYVLNLIAASLRGGTQYLKAEHKRGKEPDELVTARIEVGDQMELLF